jgi:2EXR family
MASIKKKKPAVAAAPSEKQPARSVQSKLKATVSHPPIMDKSSKFTLFPNLPMELRLKIWGFAAPDPYVIVQRESSTSKYNFTFNRPVPAVLHACKESRLEFLDENDTRNQNGTTAAKRDHPVYKLYFLVERLRSSPVFFSSEVDTLWGSKYRTSCPGKISSLGGLFWTGIASLDLSSELKHFAYTSRLSNLHSDPVSIYEAFPKLEVLTMIIDNSKPICVSWTEGKVTLRHSDMPPEIDGQIDEKGLGSAMQGYIMRYREYGEMTLLELKETNPGLKTPVLKFRFLSQYIENEGITAPP